MIGLRIENRCDMVFSATPASEGDHATLGYIPGQVLWGALAGRVYGSDKLRARAFELVHAGGIRVSPGFPLAPSGKPAFPWPQCLQKSKHDQAGSDDGLKFWNTLNGSWHEPGGRVQTEPPKLKRDFLAADGSVVSPDRAERGKAAMEVGGRRVESGRFFQYEHLGAGNAWMAWLDGDDPAVLPELADLLAGGVRLGRSKLREFGGEASVTELPGWTDPRGGAWDGKAERRLVLWCLSDIAMVDRFGTPDLAPAPDSFRLPGFEGKLDPALSLISTRRFAPYNTWLHARDREIAVIEAGSVLVYQLAKPVPLAVFRQGMGLWRERGLGLVWPDPPMLTGAGMVTVAKPSAVKRPAAPAPIELPPMWKQLLPTLQARSGSVADTRKVSDLATVIKIRLEQTIAAAALQGETPGPSQWSQVALAAARSGDAKALLERLFKTDKICEGAANPMWRLVAPALRRELEDKQKPEERIVLAALQRAARGIARTSRREERRA